MNECNSKECTLMCITGDPEWKITSEGKRASKRNEWKNDSKFIVFYCHGNWKRIYVFLFRSSEGRWGATSSLYKVYVEFQILSFSYWIFNRYWKELGMKVRCVGFIISWLKISFHLVLILIGISNFVFIHIHLSSSR